MRKKQEYRGQMRKALPSAWHPDFRNLEALPHAGVERIVLMLKIVFVVLPVLFAMSWGYLEVEAFVVRSKMWTLDDELLARIDRDKTILSQSNAYDLVAEKIEVVQYFYKAPLVPLDFLVELAQKRPSGLVLSSINITDMKAMSARDQADEPTDAAVINLQGYISDMSVSALAMMDGFKKLLATFESLKGRVGEIEVISVRRDVLSQLFTYSMTIHIRAAKD